MTAASAYNLNRPQELPRPATHATHLQVFDRQLIAAAAGRTGRQARGLTVVDLGCADGSLTVDRFSGPRFAHVLGVDRNPELIAAAAERAADDPRFSFVTADVEHDDVERVVRRWLERRLTSRTTVDIVFSALTMHHLGDPVAALRQLRRVSASPSAVIVRSADDGSKIAWPDPDGDLLRVLELTAATAGVSDRSHGRKLTAQLLAAGYGNVIVDERTLSTTGRTAAGRHALFTDSLSWRAGHLARTAGAADAASAAALPEMVDRLRALEERFADESFWYSETVYGAVASA